MNLAEHQRKLLGLFRSTYKVRHDDDPYIRKVARSKDLAEGRRNIFLWRHWVLERTAVLTFRLLKRRQLLEPAGNAFMMQYNISPFRETQTPAFLETMSGLTWKERYRAFSFRAQEQPRPKGHSSNGNKRLWSFAGPH